jgi:hypothetical protein
MKHNLRQERAALLAQVQTLIAEFLDWESQGAENLLPVRAAILSQRFDELWACVYNAPPN